MATLGITSDRLVRRLTSLGEAEIVCVLDSGRSGHLDSHLLIAGVRPIESFELKNDDPDVILNMLDDRLRQRGVAAMLTISYDFGEKLHGVRPERATAVEEPDLFLALFDALIVHDYRSGETFLTGNSLRYAEIRDLLGGESVSHSSVTGTIESQLTEQDYIEAVETVRQHIRNGITYQTNFTQQIRLAIDGEDPASAIFGRIRTEHPAAFGAFFQRRDSVVVSASPERFFKTSGDDGFSSISASPIKGTRRRGVGSDDDEALRGELMASGKDRAENTMIVDLMRNDIGRICEYGSVVVDKLCEVEEHPTLFHLVSTVSGKLRNGTTPAEIISALFPSGSITGAPKLSTMRLIATLEKQNRGLSMGSIGCRIPPGFAGIEPCFELNVAIRTMVVGGKEAVFNVGGGVVYDSDPRAEYRESLLKAKAILAACGVE